MHAHDWNQRYRSVTLLWPQRPNPLLVEAVSGLAPGRALDLGTGEGRNAVWLAEQGWQVTGVDFSEVALQRAAATAKDHGLQVEWIQADLADFVPPVEAFDLVTLLYVHLEPESRRAVLNRAVSALRPGGRLLVIGHDLDNLVGGHGGPQNPDVLYAPERIAAELPGLTIARMETVKRQVEAIEGAATTFDTVVLAVKPGNGPATLATVSARWSGTPYAFDITGPRGQIAIVDEPPPQGHDRGMKPSEMLLGALASCSAISAVSLLQKMRQPLSSLYVRVEGHQQPDWPKAFTDIHLHFMVGGDGEFDEALVEKAIDLATTRYCPVSATIELGQGGCRIDATFTLEQNGPVGPE